ncbi:hypothetical protein JQK88_34630 [Mesorhizobium caraganae]|uniref:hypothetical protein n=1 Tax=Mesorhizobium caraganae TaxID=483206 RepID=UPI00193A27E7|nr:hypothetical protein [Mesorhizobium caraganae]MBM2716207.1 hypothetical protein [Mesorhizobium caraganae]
MIMHSCARNLRALAFAATLSVWALPSSAKDIVAFVDQVTAKANPSQALILHNKETWASNLIDTIVARLNAKNFKYDLQGYNQGDRPRDIARPFSWPSYGAVFCMGQAMDCDQVKAQAEAKGFEGDFYNAMLEKR